MSLIDQFKSNLRTLMLMFFISTTLIIVVLIPFLWQGIPIYKLTRDITATTKAPFYTGFLSQIGFLFWGGTVTICFFGAKNLQFNNDILLKKFFLISGLFTLLLGLDDMFMLHEQVYPFFLGISEKLVFSTYGIFVLVFSISFYKLILKSQYIFLLIAFLFFGTSILLDLINPTISYPFLWEDGAKMMGIISWFFYFFSQLSLTTQNN